MALTFRRRIFAWLVVVACIPAGVGIALALLTPRIAAPVGGVAAWDRAAATWRDAERALARQDLSTGARAAMARHSRELSNSFKRAHESLVIRNAAAAMLVGVAAALAALVALGTVRLAGHLSRQLSRPIDELIAWTGHLTRGEPLPDDPPARGAPEFDVLRRAFRRMATELAAARTREVEAAELRAFRDLARQVAHELKNPLTPLRFASQRLAQDARADQKELADIIVGESERIERMARDFATLGRLPEGPPAPVDLGELAETLARTTAPADVTVRLERPAGLPMISGHYEPLRRALSNLILNACDACAEARGQGSGTDAPPGEITIALRAVANGDADSAGEAVEMVIADNGVGIAPEHLSRVFEPYFTTKTQGTGLGLALVRQTIHDHGGTIAVASRLGSGTTFTIRLPLGRA